jgi:hypothetical protein
MYNREEPNENYNLRGMRGMGTPSVRERITVRLNVPENFQE